jgi:hypothetical protein
LAALTPLSLMPIGRLLRSAASDLPWGATILLVSTIAPDPTQAAMLALRERGRSVAWLFLGEEAPPQLPGVPIRHAPPAGDWQRPGAAR